MPRASHIIAINAPALITASEPAELAKVDLSELRNAASLRDQILRDQIELKTMPWSDIDDPCAVVDAACKTPSPTNANMLSALHRYAVEDAGLGGIPGMPTPVGQTGPSLKNPADASEVFGDIVQDFTDSGVVSTGMAQDPQIHAALRITLETETAPCDVVDTACWPQTPTPTNASKLLSLGSPTLVAADLLNQWPQMWLPGTFAAEAGTTADSYLSTSGGVLGPQTSAGLMMAPSAYSVPLDYQNMMQCQFSASNTDAVIPTEHRPPNREQQGLRNVQPVALHSTLPAQTPEDGDDDNSFTTVMWRNLPGNWSHDLIEKALCAKGFAGTYNFVYAPYDLFNPSHGPALKPALQGYAFIDFVDHATACRFMHLFAGFKDWNNASSKRSEVAWSQQQGLECHIRRFRNSSVMHEEVPDMCKPRLLENGLKVDFPAPTRRLSKPQPRDGREHARRSS